MIMGEWALTEKAMLSWSKSVNAPSFSYCRNGRSWMSLRLEAAQEFSSPLSVLLVRYHMFLWCLLIFSALRAFCSRTGERVDSRVPLRTGESHCLVSRLWMCLLLFAQEEIYLPEKLKQSILDLFDGNQRLTPFGIFNKFEARHQSRMPTVRYAGLTNLLRAIRELRVHSMPDGTRLYEKREGLESVRICSLRHVSSVAYEFPYCGFPKKSAFAPQFLRWSMLHIPPQTLYHAGKEVVYAITWTSGSQCDQALSELLR